MCNYTRRNSDRLLFFHMAVDRIGCSARQYDLQRLRLARAKPMSRSAFDRYTPLYSTLLYFTLLYSTILSWLWAGGAPMFCAPGPASEAGGAASPPSARLLALGTSQRRGPLSCSKTAVAMGDESMHPNIHASRCQNNNTTFERGVHFYVQTSAVP